LRIAEPLLKSLEGFEPVSKWDVDAWAIGFGHHGKEVRQGQTIDLATAESVLLADAGAVADLIIPKLPLILNPNQLAALISFAFNVGPGGKTKDGFLRLKTGEPSTLFKLVWAMPPDATPDQLAPIGDEFLKWVYVGDQPDSGLCSRRTRERGLYLTPFSPNPGPENGLPSPGTNSSKGQ
jgi:lysozyme